MLRDELTAEDLLEYERRKAWIYKARERFYEETKGMTDKEIRDIIRERARSRPSANTCSADARQSSLSCR